MDVELSDVEVACARHFLSSKGFLAMQIVSQSRQGTRIAIPDLRQSA
jgi:hypothetical protein